MMARTREIVSFIVIKDTADLKRKLEAILEKYGVGATGQIEDGIRDGNVPEHQSTKIASKRVPSNKQLRV